MIRTVRDVCHFQVQDSTNNLSLFQGHSQGTPDKEFDHGKAVTYVALRAWDLNTYMCYVLTRNSHWTRNPPHDALDTMHTKPELSAAKIHLIRAQSSETRYRIRS